jgi:hypothetical protein
MVLDTALKEVYFAAFCLGISNLTLNSENAVADFCTLFFLWSAVYHEL